MCLFPPPNLCLSFFTVKFIFLADKTWAYNTLPGFSYKLTGLCERRWPWTVNSLCLHSSSSGRCEYIAVCSFEMMSMAFDIIKLWNEEVLVSYISLLGSSFGSWLVHLVFGKRGRKWQKVREVFVMIKFIFFTLPPKNYKGYQIEDDEMDGPRNTRGRDEKFIQGFSWNTWREDAAWEI